MTTNRTPTEGITIRIRTILAAAAAPAALGAVLLGTAGQASANPVTGAPWTHLGVFGGRINYQVTTTGTPSARNLPAVEPGTVHTGDILAQLFGAPVTTVSASDSFTYHGIFTHHGIPGYPGGWVQS